ncbi:MAG: hypothetical protein IJI20_02175, partial [Firmicutes bacterium]|nr:hypothetical protein [Bacillota bacterium]
SKATFSTVFYRFDILASDVYYAESLSDDQFGKLPHIWNASCIRISGRTQETLDISFSYVE